MTLYILDTDHVTLHQHQNPHLIGRILEAGVENLAITAITIEEQMRGRLAQLNRPDKDLNLAYQRLIATSHYFCDLTILTFDNESQEQYEWIQSQKIRIGTMDKRIAAIVLRHEATLVTRNSQDFRQIPGLQFVDRSQ